LLYKSIPESWIKNQYVAASLATFILLGCQNKNTAANPLNIEIVDKINSDEKEQTTQKQDSVKVAPIFVHGEGSGAVGCVAMSPPVFISEDDAKKIIFNALQKEGIIFDTTDCSEIQFKTSAIANSCSGWDGKKLPDTKVQLKMDGYNKELNLAIQYVSKTDFIKFKSKDYGGCSVQGYKTKEAAEIIREELVTNGTTNAVVFYDPIATQNRESKKLLLQQVEDFVKWLRAEHIIEN
jgi:hypothetical protein